MNQEELDTEKTDTEKTDNDLIISKIESIAQVENESRSDNNKSGIKQPAANGTADCTNAY